MRCSHIVAIVAGLLLVSGAIGAEVISGEPRIVVGDTGQIGATKIRFAGIDSPETDQVCLDAKGERWACGIAARDELIKYSGRRWECDLVGTDRYGRALGKCFVEGEDISAWMVRSGWALSFVRYSHDYDRDEVAREAKAGIWAGAFIAPWDWRHRNEQTVVLGAFSVPVNAQKVLLGAVSAAEAPSPDCTIKANVGRGECIYHLPGDRWYGKMRMDSGKRRFCTVAEAEAAGVAPLRTETGVDRGGAPQRHRFTGGRQTHPAPSLLPHSGCSEMISAHPTSRQRGYSKR